MLQMKKRRNLTWCMLAALMLCLFASSTSATEVQWTGNEDDQAEGNSGPLPLSMQQRQQLLQLEEVIRQSPNPEETLKQAADANGMSPQDLASMLERNRNDLEQGNVEAGGGGGGGGVKGAIGGVVGKLVTTLFALITRSASQNPKSFAIVVTTLLILLCLAISAPRTGLELSSQRRGLLSKGPTTILQPPPKFLERRLASEKWQQRNDKSLEVNRRIWRDLMLQDDDGTEWHSLPRKSDLARAATTQITIPIDFFLEEKEEADADDEEEEELIDYTMELCYNHAVDLLATRTLTEYTPQQGSVRLHTLQNDPRKRYASLVVKKLGDWGRYGIIPLQVTSQQESDLETSLTFSTLKVAQFAGQIHVSVEKTRRRRKKTNGDNSTGKKQQSIVLAVHLAIPKGGNKLSKTMSLKIVESIAKSLEASIKKRTKQSLVRRSQSSRFQGKARARAEERRSNRFEKEKQLEEMAEDRRRKWQRNNPDAGRYRPSGNMMKGPNHPHS